MSLDVEMPACCGDAASYHPRRLTQLPPPPPPLTQLPPRLVHPPPPPWTQAPRLLTQPASALEPEASVPRTTPPITARDHFLRLWRKSLLWSNSASSAVSALCCLW